MKRIFVFAVAGSILGVGISSVAFADGAELYGKKCAACHGKTGKGDTPMGKKNGAKDFATVKLSVAEIEKVISDGKAGEDGKTKSPAFKGKLSADDIKAVAAYVLSFQK